PLEPPRNFVVVVGHIPTGIEKLVQIAKGGKELTPAEARQGDATARWLLMLADLYHEAEQWDRSLALCSRVIESKGFQPSAAQRSWAYFRRGRNYYCLEKQNPEEAYSNYLAAASGWPKADWADDAIFLAANIQWNHYQNADAAAALWRRLLQTYPDSNEAARAAYFIGVVYHWSGRLKEARQAYEEAMKKFPNSLFTNLVKSGLEELDRQEKGKP
ncbi:MAG: tetratricopeptide repeat protein, partial [Thermoguttaceae bacterium]|nr:tetratricopeptide repeat protein [Thermoguttaceae bacterium]